MLRTKSSAEEQFLMLPSPHINIILTPPRLPSEDAEHIVRIANDPAVCTWLESPPYPYKWEHAEQWLQETREACTQAWRAVQERTAQHESDHVKSRDDDTERSCSRFVDECPVRAIREVCIDGAEIYIGDITLRRHDFAELVDEDVKEEMRKENERRPAGDKGIVWAIGYCLSSSHHGYGIMTAAVKVLLEWAIEHMNVARVSALVHEGNVGSFRVFEKNGFVYQRTVKDALTVPESKGGGKRSYQLLTWERPCIQ